MKIISVSLLILTLSGCPLFAAQATEDTSLVQTVSSSPSFNGNADELISKARHFLKEKGYPVQDYIITDFTLSGIKFYDWQIDFHKPGVVEYLTVSGRKDSKTPLNLQTYIGQYLPSTSVDKVISKAREIAAENKYSLSNYFISKIEYLKDPQYVWRVTFCKNATLEEAFSVYLMDMAGIVKTWIEIAK